jgi:hypothetical protein
MDNKETEKAFDLMKDQNTVPYFSIKKTTTDTNGNSDGEGDIFILANKNGILSFCKMLMASIDQQFLEKDSVYNVPDEFQDDSEVWITHIKVAEGNQHPVEHKKSFGDHVVEKGCLLGLAAIVIVFIVGVVSTFQWLIKILE